uniref:LOB domain-containing protein n=1 Tax=Meloidogyne hapla TaxID=6305 RepID=A0A1I8BE58_MELHA
MSVSHEFEEFYTEQALRGVRLNGVGPLTVCSPGPINLMEHQQQICEQFHNTVEIHQIQQNPNIWEGVGVIDEQQQKQHLIETSFSNQLAIMSSNPSNVMHVPVSMSSIFLQQAISE